MDFIIEIVLRVIFIVPGAFIRWLLGGGKKPLKHYVSNDGDGYINSTIGIFLFVFIVIFVRSVLYR